MDAFCAHHIHHNICVCCRMVSASGKKCDICEKYFPQQIFTFHQSLHYEDKFHPCKKTFGKFFTSKDELLKHNCDEVLKRFACDLCNKVLCDETNLALHKR